MSVEAKGFGADVVPLTVLAAAVALGLSFAGGAAAQDADNSGAAPAGYTSAQMRRGTQIFNDNCAGCHGMHLEGYQESPPLKGEKFEADFFGQPASELFDFISTNMPMDNPGGLEPQQYADVIAFLLKQWGVKAGKVEFPSDESEMAGLMMPTAE